MIDFCNKNDNMNETIVGYFKRLMEFGMIKCSHKNNTAFTLIELLVVVAIISLLVSILLPNLSMAKQLAQQVTCASNLRNIGTATAMYTADNDGAIPVVIDVYGMLGPGGSQHVQYGSPTRCLPEFYEDMELAERKLFNCPTIDKTLTAGYYGTNGTSLHPNQKYPYNYSYNCYYANADVDNSYASPRKIQDIPAPDRAFLISGSVVWPHRKGADIEARNTLYADSHVYLVDYDEYWELAYRGWGYYAQAGWRKGT